MLSYTSDARCCTLSYHVYITFYLWERRKNLWSLLHRQTVAIYVMYPTLLEATISAGCRIDTKCNAGS